VTLSRKTAPRLSLGQVLARFAGHRVLVIGGVTLDQYLDGQSSRFAPALPPDGEDAAPLPPLLDTMVDSRSCTDDRQ
jgi:hypothetical protein